ncbi:hypothetical protein I317_00060 [Kwoniella heveanensis CBS 569]|nr:hypothetical protein I317_00060 [Kwoniella heveanensis CBS 569]
MERRDMPTGNVYMIKVYHFSSGSADEPVVNGPFETSLGEDEQLSVAFQRWHDQHEKEFPAEQAEWLLFPFGEPNTESTVHVPAPLHAHQETNIYVKHRSAHIDYTHLAIFSQS